MEPSQTPRPLVPSQRLSQWHRQPFFFSSSHHQGKEIIAELFNVCKTLPRPLATSPFFISSWDPKDIGYCDFSFLSIISTCPQPHEYVPWEVMNTEGRGSKATPKLSCTNRVYQARVNSSGCKPGHPTPHLKNMQWLPVPIWVAKHPHPVLELHYLEVETV